MQSVLDMYPSSLFSASVACTYAWCWNNLISLQTACVWNAGQSVDHHFLSAYYDAMLSVILAQFTSKGFADGVEGIVRIAESSDFIAVNITVDLLGVVVKSIVLYAYCKEHMYL